MKTPARYTFSQRVHDFGFRKAVRQAFRSGIDAALLFGIRRRYPGGIIVGAHFTGPILLSSETSVALVRDNRITLPATPVMPPISVHGNFFRGN